MEETDRPAARSDEEPLTNRAKPAGVKDAGTHGSRSGASHRRPSTGDIKSGSIPQVKEIDLEFDAFADEDFSEPALPYQCAYHELSGSDNISYAVVVGYDASSEHAQGRDARSLPAAIMIHNSSLSLLLRELKFLAAHRRGQLFVAFKDKILVRLNERIASAGAESIESDKLYRCFLDLVDRTVEGVIKQQSYVSLHSSIKFDDLWMIFRPGGIVVDSAMPHAGPIQQARRIWSVHRLEEGNQPRNTFRLVCYLFDFDGRKFRPQWNVVDIARFSGSRSIATLPVFPTSITKNLDAELEQRGKRFLSNCRGRGRYKGRTVSDHVLFGMDYFQEVTSEYIDEEVFVDFEAAYDFSPDVRQLQQQLRLRTSVWHPLWHPPEPTVDEPRFVPIACKQCHSKLFNSRQVQYLQHREFYQDQPREVTRFEADGVFTGGEEALLPPYLLGMSLRTKKWQVLSLALFSPGRRRPSVTPHIASGHFAVLKAAVNSSSPIGEATGKDSTENNDDLETHPHDVKDRGLVVLLHGPPGSGKANCVKAAAESASPARLVYHIRGGEPPSEPEKFASFVRNSLELANRWNGVVLFEDAEIYLSERDGDMNRSRIVSLFLNILDEFQGVIFLTTGRVGLIDEALKARIHFALAFPHPSVHGSKSIWKGLMNRGYKQGDRDVTFKAKELMQWASRHAGDSARKRRPWNEKRIANAIQAAITLAAEGRGGSDTDSGAEKPDLGDPRKDGDKLPQKIELGENHLRLVARMTNMFDSYLEECRGNDEDRASEFSIRADKFEYDEDSGRTASTRMDSYPTRRGVKKGVTSPPKGKALKARFDSESDSEESSLPEEESEDESDSTDSVRFVRKKLRK
ncbi:hypothetical protein F5B21DRAFT_498949 [Xylaria acuta]|nr:hypothetical protein F5B21DRAFT_498949 [Xylaria acuta]